MHVETNDDWDSPRELTPPAPALTESNVQEKKPKKKKSIFWSMASNSSNAGASDSGLSDDGEGSSRAGAGAASKSQRLKFSKGKKLHKSMSQAYMKQLNAAKGSKFANWTKAELVELLIHHHIGDESDGIHIRNEANIDVVVLRDMADELFEDKDPPPKPRLPGLEEVVLKNVMARRIQDAWVEYQYAKRERVEMHRSMYYRDQVRRIESHHEVDKIGKAELLYMSLGGTAGDIEQGGNDMMLTEDQDAANLVLNESFLLQDRTQLDDLERRYEAKSNEPSGPLVSSRDSNDQKKRQNVLDLPWQPPNIERAQRYADYVQPRKGGKGGKLFDYFNTTTGRHCCLGSLGEQFDLWEEGRISEFSIYGPGVTNYFKFIKFALWLFLLLTVLSLPMLALNSVPDNKDDEIGLKQLASTTIGNLAVTQVNGTLSIDVPGCDSFALLGSTCRFDGKDLSLLYSVLDIIISCVVFIGFIWLSLFEQYEEIELNRSTIKASMYTIVVSNLPQDVTEVDLLNHFGSIVGRKDAISCISLAYNNEDEIELCKKRGDIIRKKIILVHEHRRDCTRLNGRTDLSEEDKNVRLVNDRNAFFEKMKKLNQDLSTLEKQLEDLSKEELGVVYAYITFNKSTDRDIAYDAYHKNTLYAYLFNKTKRLLLNNQLLVVNHAPEPSVILWENLQYSYYERWKRRGVTIILSLFFIIITLAMIFSSKYLQEKASNNGYKSASVCPGDFTTWTIAEQQSYVDQNPSYLHCYCDQYSAIDQADDSYCKSYLQDTINSQVLMYFASFIVLVVNALITYIFKIYVMYEKHHTSDGQGISIFFRLFVLKYINTACVFLINNNNVILRSIFNIHISSAPSFTAKWYNSVGVTIILVQLGDIITGNLDGIIKCITYYSRRYRAFNNPESLLTQEQLNKQFVGPEFEFAFNYAQIMATLFVTLTFSTGIPLLYPIAAANFCLSYWIEKFLFINVYKIPPHFNTVVGRRASGLIPIAILIHIAVAIWMLSNKSIFTDEIATNNESLAEYYYSSSSSGQSAGDITFNARRRVTEDATLPLFILFFIILFIWIFMYVTQFVTIGLERFYTFYLGCTTNEENRESNAGALKAFKKAQESVTYVRAVKRNLIKGLATYNILQNPAYKEAFGITWKFAIDHHDVRSIRKHKLRAQHSEFEDNADEIESLQRSALAHSLPHKIHHVHTEQPTSSTGPPPTIASRRTKRPSHSETGSAASEASRLSYKSVTKNRSFYGSFYEQQKSEQIILQIDKQKEFQNLMKQERKGRSGGAGSSTDKKKRREKRSGGGGGSGTTSPPPPPPSAISPTPASAVQERRKGKSSDKSPGTSGRSKSRHPPPVTLKQSHHPMAGRPLPSSNPTSPQPSSSRNNYAPVPVVAEAHAINAEAIDPNHFDIEMRPNPFDPRIHQYHHQQYYPGAAQHPPPPVQYVPMTGGPSAISSPTTSGSYAGALGGAFPQQYPSRGGEHRHLHRPRQGQPKPHQYY